MEEQHEDHNVAMAPTTEELQRRKVELEKEMVALLAELEAARLSAEAVEKGEERLCAQLGEASPRAPCAAKTRGGRRVSNTRQPDVSSGAESGRNQPAKRAC
jgi:hypothetical protein